MSQTIYASMLYEGLQRQIEEEKKQVEEAQKEKAAVAAGFLSLADLRIARAEGYPDPSNWAEVRDRVMKERWARTQERLERDRLQVAEWREADSFKKEIIAACKQRIRSDVTHPSTVSFGWFPTAERHPSFKPKSQRVLNGSNENAYWEVIQSFSAKNSYGLKLHYKANCRFDFGRRVMTSFRYFEE